MRLRNKWRQCLALATVTAMMASTPMPAYAGTWYLDEGDITVRSSDEEGTNLVSQNETRDQRDKDTVVTNRRSESNSNSSSSSTGSSSTSHTITIDTGNSADNKVEVTIKDVNIDVSKGDSSGKEAAAVTVKGSGETTIELDGDNTVKSYAGHAGVEKNGTSGSLVIQDEKTEEGRDTASTLTAVGGTSGAGIGSGSGKTASNITITSGDVTAIGGGTGSGAGIGSGGDGTANNITIAGGTIEATGTGSAGIGAGGMAKNITISGGDVTATGGNGAPGIGGGGVTKNIEVSGGTVTANGGYQGAGIGSGDDGAVNGITISGGTVTATGGGSAAGIGSGNGMVARNITIEGGDVTATGSGWAAGIGGGSRGAANTITISGGTVNATGGQGGYGSGAGIGGGYEANATNITISGGTVTATAGPRAAGIGGGYEGSGTNISITGGATTATAGNYGGAAIGAGGGGKSASVEIKDQAAVVVNNKSGKYIGTDSTELTENIDTSDVYYNHKGTYTHSSGNDGVAVTSEVLHYTAASDDADGYTGTTFENGVLTLGVTIRHYQAPTDTEDGYSGDIYDKATGTFTPGTVLRHPVAASETADGYTGDYVDENGQVVRGQIIHTKDAGTVTMEPTETSEGKREYHCVVCGTLLETETIDKLEPAPTPDNGGDPAEQNTGVEEHHADHADHGTKASEVTPAASAATTTTATSTGSLRVLDRASQDVTDNTEIVSQNTAGTVRTIHAERLAIGTLEGTLQDLLDLQAQGITTVVYVTAYRTSTLHIADLVGLGSGMTRFVLYHAADAASLTVGGVSYGGLIR